MINKSDKWAKVKERAVSKNSHPFPLYEKCPEKSAKPD
jgi:hypothetical protein